MTAAALLSSFLALRSMGAEPVQAAVATSTAPGAALAEAEAAVRGASTDDADAWLRLGQAYDALGRSTEAVAAIERAAAIAPRHPGVYHALAAIYWRQGRPDKARATFQAAKERCPNCVEADIERGYFELAAGDTRTATALFDAASHGRAPYVGYHHLASQYGSREGRLAESETLFRKAIELEEAAGDQHYLAHTLSNFAAVLSSLGRTHEAAVIAARAVATARGAAEARPQLPLALVREAEILRGLGQLDQSRRDYSEAAKLIRRSLFPEPLDEGGIDVALGELAAESGDDAGAERHFLRAERVARGRQDPGRWFAARSALERLYGRTGRRALAAAAHRQTERELQKALGETAIPGAPRFGQLLRCLADLQLQAGDRASALATLKRWRDVEPDALGLGELYARAGDTEDALAVYRAARAARPEDVRPLRALARLLRATGASREAADVAHAGRALCPSCPEFEEERR